MFSLRFVLLHLQHLPTEEGGEAGGGGGGQDDQVWVLHPFSPRVSTLSDGHHWDQERKENTP